MPIWDTIYKNYQNGGLAWASLKDGLHPDFMEFIEYANFEIKNALDIGCGDGKYLLFLQKLGFQITGIDSSPTAISMAREAAFREWNPPMDNKLSTHKFHWRRCSLIHQNSVP